MKKNNGGGYSGYLHDLTSDGEQWKTGNILISVTNVNLEVGQISVSCKNTKSGVYDIVNIDISRNGGYRHDYRQLGNTKYYVIAFYSS